MKAFITVAVVLGICSLADAFQKISDAMNPALDMLRPIIENFNHLEMPASYGSCDGAPKPCECFKPEGYEGPVCQNLYEVKENWKYRARARWISGLNTVEIHTLSMSEATGMNGIILTASGSFKELPLSLKVQQCATFNLCTTMWDGTNGCCGEDVNFQLKLNFSCDGLRVDPLLGSILSPYFMKAKVESVYVDEIKLRQSLIPGMRAIIGATTLVDLTSTVTDLVHDEIQAYIDKEEPWIPFYGRDLTFLEAVNTFTNLQTGAKEMMCM